MRRRIAQALHSLAYWVDSDLYWVVTVRMISREDAEDVYGGVDRVPPNVRVWPAIELGEERT